MEGIFVGPVSPIKTSRNNAKVKYFEGQLSDGSKTVRFVSFEPKLRSQVEQAKEGLRGAALANCTVKRSREAGELEVLISSQRFRIRQRSLRLCEER